MTTEEAQEVESPSSQEVRQPVRRSTWHLYHVVAGRITSSYLNILLILMPLGVVSGFLGLADVVVFPLNLLAMVPLMAWITFSIGQLATSVGYFADELLKATLGSAIEMLVGIIALSRGQMLVVQRTLVGSILLYSLLVLGCCIFVAGCDRKRVQFERTTTSIMSSLMVVVSISLIVPTTMSAFPPAGDASRDRGHSDILRVSHCIAIVLFIMLLVFVLFHFRTHRALFQSNPTARDDGLTEDDSVADEGDVFTLNTWAASCVLITATLAMIACVTFVVKSVDDVARRTGISAAFLVVVLVPLVGNATKSATMVAVARKGEIDQAVRSIIGSNLRILILLTPVLVLMGWILDQPLTLQLDTFDATMFFLAIMVMNYLIRDGRSNYFEGLVLVGTYVIIAVAFNMRPIPPDNIIFL